MIAIDHQVGGGGPDRETETGTEEAEEEEEETDLTGIEEEVDLTQDHAIEEIGTGIEIEEDQGVMTEEETTRETITKIVEIEIEETEEISTTIEEIIEGLMTEEDSEETIVKTIAGRTLTHATGNTTKMISRTTESDRKVVIEMKTKEDTHLKDEEVTTIMTTPRTSLMPFETMKAVSATTSSKMVTQMKETETIRMK
jgi:hypothetical protein